MASQYGYITISDLHGSDDFFLSLNPNYTNAFVESKITEAEYMVNTITSTTYSGTIPDSVKLACIQAANILMEWEMYKDGIIPQPPSIDKNQMYNLMAEMLKNEDTELNIWVF